MGKEKQKLFKRVIVFLAVLAMIVTSIPVTRHPVMAKTNDTGKTKLATVTDATEVYFKSADYRKMNVGDTYKFELAGNTKGAKYQWSIDQPSIATVSKKGVVKALSVGNTTLTCKVTVGESVTELTATIFVMKAKKQLPKSVKINNKITSMTPGEIYDLNRTLSPKNSSDYVNWTSSNPQVATVDKNGVVTANTKGTVKITVTGLNSKVKDSVLITVTDQVVASTQKDIDRFLKAGSVSKLTINTKKEVELTIPEGDYSTTNLVVNAPNATISNNGVFEEVTIRAIKENTWKEFAKNKIHLLSNASIIVGKNADAEVTIGRTGIKAKLEINGSAKVFADKKCDLSFLGLTSDLTQVTIGAKNTDIKTEIPLNIVARFQVTIELLSKEASNTSVQVEDESQLPVIQGEGTITVMLGDKKLVISASAEVEIVENSTPVQGSNESRVPVDQNGLDKDGRAVVYFGSPDQVDGVIDDIWKKAEPATLTKYSADTSTKATIKLLWDDNALYFLAEVKDEELSVESGNVYEKDSVEVFVDEDNKRGGTYEGDDVQFRINYKNEQSSDHGDLTNLYSAAKEVPGGYVIEGRIALSQPVANNKVMGLESQVNDAKGSYRVATINLFDTTGTAFQDTSKFGEMILVGKGENDVSKPNYYDLKSLVTSAKDIELERYVNGNVVENLIEESERAIADPKATQAQFDELLVKLQNAMDALMHNTESFDEKECRDIPKAYRMYDPESQRGTIVQVNYKTNTYDQEAKDLEKYMLVYLPNGYDPNDTTKKYNVLYLIHGMSESQHTAFGGVGQNTELMRVVDNLIADGKMEPMIIVTPTWYNTLPYSPDRQQEDGLFRIKNFHNELVSDIIPTIESTYHVYAKSTSEADLIAAREHRAVGGFSMGSACTWYNYIYGVDYFKYYVPVSLWCWQDIESIKSEGFPVLEGDSEDTTKAKYLANIPAKSGYTKDDIRIFCATGTADLAYGGMNSQIAEMKKLDDMFVYSADLRKGNFYYITLPGGAHNWTCVNRYLYNILPDLFQPYWTDDYGLTEAGAATASFGSPMIDGDIDAIWSEAKPIIPKYVSTPENTKATFRAMWDNNALYILAEVKDENVTKDSVNPYEQDSIEIFVDENNDKTVEFGVDDLQFRVNYANDATADKGDILRLYSKTKTVDGGYVIETSIQWAKDVANDDVIGLELQINDGKGATRVGTINVFDGTNNAWQNTSLFGNLILKGKTEDSVSGVNPYKLLGLIRSVDDFDRSEYTAESLEKLDNEIKAAKIALAKADVTQEELDAYYESIQQKLQVSENGLEYTEEAKKVKHFVAMPSWYKSQTVTGGAITVTGSSIEMKSYETPKKTDSSIMDKKFYNVYLPAGYDASDSNKKYNVFYLMHGGGENENTLFGGPGQNLELKRILDNMIANGDMEPMIVVTPTFYGGEDDVATFYKELLNTLIPQVEKEYNTYLVGEGTLEDISNSREHRAFGGFSMGSACTWYVFINCLDYIKYYVPLSGDCWQLSGTASANMAKETAEFLQGVVKKKGLDFKLLCATGSGDIAYPNMAPQMEELKKLTDTFIFNQDISIGNTYFMVAKGGTHAWNFVNQYLYNIMPDLFQ